MRLNMFVNDNAGSLVPISGIDPVKGAWAHQAFVPTPLPTLTPELSAPSYLAVANARAAIAALDVMSRQVVQPGDGWLFTDC